LFFHRNLYHSDTIVVRCGDWDTQAEVEPINHQELMVEKIIIHPGYVESNLHNDFAVLIMTYSFSLDQNVNPICLPGETNANSYSPQNCVATGWGKDIVKLPRDLPYGDIILHTFIG
jgi:hypothetical protein